MSEPLLTAQGLAKRFGGVQAVRDLSLVAAAGSVLAVIGPNGAGKSTLLNLLSGIYQPDAGTLSLAGVDLTGLADHRRARLGIARTFQKIRLFKQLSALDNVLAGFHRHHRLRPWQYLLQGGAVARDRARRQEEAQALLAFVGLERRAAATAGAMAYGEQRMLEIARALATGPRLLMVDEPAAGLNAAEVEGLFQRIDGLRRRGMSVVVVEHNMDLVMSIADRVMVMDYGQTLFEGTPGEVQRHPAVIAAYLGTELA